MFVQFQHGYIPGKDFFFAPYDWRLGLKELEEQVSKANGIHVRAMVAAITMHNGHNATVCML